jgi:hypothetical protein
MLAPLMALLLFADVVPNGGFAHVGPTPPPHGYPAITSVSISSTEIHAGRPVHGDVQTSANVRYVEARIDYRSVALHETGPGTFTLDYTVPWWLPPWLRHGYTLQIIARSIDGVETARDIAITVK